MGTVFKNITDQCVNGVEMNKLHPDTFQIPSASHKSNILANMYVKIGVFAKSVHSEKFWVKVIGVMDGMIYGTVNNDLICTDEHNLKCDDEVCFHVDAVLDILEE